MAQAPKQAADRAAFVREIVSDPKAVPDVMLLYGYLGASSEEGHERLYLSPDLTNYVEVPTSAVLHQMPAPKEQDPHGGVTLWVKKDAALVYKMAPAAEALAHYFAGAIAVSPCTQKPRNLRWKAKPSRAPRCWKGFLAPARRVSKSQKWLVHLPPEPALLRPKVGRSERAF